MVIRILFHDSGYRCLRHFYKEKVCRHIRHLFPKVVSYNRFAELEKEVAIPLALFIKKALLGKCTGIRFVDSTPLRVRFDFPFGRRAKPSVTKWHSLSVNYDLRKSSNFIIELGLIYVTRWQKCPIWGFLLTPHACDIGKLFPAGRVQRNLRRVVTIW